MQLAPKVRGRGMRKSKVGRNIRRYLNIYCACRVGTMFSFRNCGSFRFTTIDDRHSSPDLSPELVESSFKASWLAREEF